MRLRPDFVGSQEPDFTESSIAPRSDGEYKERNDGTLDLRIVNVREMELICDGDFLNDER
jgi:hypothetical protein